MATRRWTNMCGVALLLGVLIGAASPALGDPVTRTWSSYYVNYYVKPVAVPAGAVAVADFNADGRMDVATVSTYGGLLTIGLDQSSSPLRSYAAGRWAAGLAVGDFDHDGDIDVAVVVQDNNGVAILSNDGAGVFTRTALYATGLAPQAVVAADLDRDGWLDLVVANRGDGSLTVLGNTGGTFAVRQTIPLPLVVEDAPAGVSCEPAHMVAADLDQDGWTDVAVTCAADDTVKVLTNAAGVLSPAGTYDAGPYPLGITAADLNGDGQMDLAVADREAPQVTLLLADPVVGYQRQEMFYVAVPYGAFEPAVGIAATDVNADGATDILVAGMTLQNDGNASFMIASTTSQFGAVYGCGSLVGDAGRYVGFVAGESESTSRVQMTYYPAATPATIEVPLPGDANGDDFVNVGDLQVLVGSWGKTVGDAGCDANADLNGDGYVNIGDLQILVGNWGTSR